MGWFGPTRNLIAYVFVFYWVQELLLVYILRFVGLYADGRICCLAKRFISARNPGRNGIALYGLSSPGKRFSDEKFQKFSLLACCMELETVSSTRRIKISQKNQSVTANLVL